jgi:hypothetical protein
MRYSSVSNLLLRITSATQGVLFSVVLSTGVHVLLNVGGTWQFAAENRAVKHHAMTSRLWP